MSPSPSARHARFFEKCALARIMRWRRRPAIADDEVVLREGVVQRRADLFRASFRPCRVVLTHVGFYFFDLGAAEPLDALPLQDIKTVVFAACDMRLVCHRRRDVHLQLPEAEPWEESCARLAPSSLFRVVRETTEPGPAKKKEVGWVCFSLAPPTRDDCPICLQDLADTPGAHTLDAALKNPVANHKHRDILWSRGTDASSCVRLLRCGHEFHAICFRRYLASLGAGTAGIQERCPFCKQYLVWQQMPNS